MCVTIFGISICVSRVQPRDIIAHWYAGMESETTENRLNERQQEAMMLSLLQGRHT